MDEKTSTCPAGLEVVSFGGDTWRFRYPGFGGETQDAFYAILNDWRSGASLNYLEERLEHLIEEHPEHIDARHHLALFLSQAGRVDAAHTLWRQTVETALACMPEAFELGQDRVPWLELDNRPFLRAYHGLALSFANRGDVRKALQMFQDLLAMNPGDNQGARALVVDMSFYLEKPAAVLEVCEAYPNDSLPEILYGRALAHYQLGHEADADDALRLAIDRLPNIAEELVKTRHVKPDSFREDRVTMGGADEAYHYWIDQGPYWEQTPGAIAWVRGQSEGE